MDAFAAAREANVYEWLKGTRQPPNGTFMLTWLLS